VSGIFQEAAYQSYGSDLAPMKTYLMSKLLWNPQLNDTAVMEEFFTLYYGAGAPASNMMRYVRLWSKSVAETNTYMGESVPVTSTYLTPHALLLSATLTSPAPTIPVTIVTNVSGNVSGNVLGSSVGGSVNGVTAMQAQRMRIASLSTLYVILLRWNEIYEYALKENIGWPYSSAKDLKTAFEMFSNIFVNDANGTLLSEGGGHDLKWLKEELKL
jgi:hypothetical protein